MIKSKTFQINQKLLSDYIKKYELNLVLEGKKSDIIKKIIEELKEDPASEIYACKIKTNKNIKSSDINNYLKYA